ncbi:hotdog fold thioesterase [Kocuria marina]|uniref:hotdog fold thioesterase n=1 Tax=Kocuria marina TaxID=223184 RepID=UPI003F289A32
MRQPVEEWLGATVVSSGDGESVVQMTVTDQHVNGAGILHGGALFALADAALAHAAIIPDTGATTGAQIAFIAPCHPGDELVATARTTARWGANALVDVTVRSERATVAEFRGQVRCPLR